MRKQMTQIRIKGVIVLLVLVLVTALTAYAQAAEPKERIDVGKDGKLIQTEMPKEVYAPKETYTYIPGERRDPFVSLLSAGEKGGNLGDELTPLQRVDLGDLKLVGIVKNPGGNTALIQTPDGKGYLLRKGIRVGKNEGIVESISDDKVVVKEKKTDFLGQIKVSDFVLTLKKEEGRR